MDNEFENILKIVGDYGLYQILLTYLVMFPSAMLVAWFTFHPVFVAHTPDHWCYVREVALTNLSIAQQKLLIRPDSDPCCSTYDINYTSLLQNDAWTTENRTLWPTKPCDSGWQYETETYTATAVTSWNLVCSDAYFSSTVISMFFVGDVIGTPVSGYLSDRFGRRTTLIGLAIVTGISEITSAYIPNFSIFLFLRALNGAGASSLYILSYILLLEIVGTGLRARMNTVACCGWTFGSCLLPLMVWLAGNWETSTIIGACFILFFTIAYMIIHESPRWLLIQERFDEATEVLFDIGRKNGRSSLDITDLRTRLEKLGEQMKRDGERKQKVSVLDLVRFPILRLKFILLTFCWIGSAMAFFGLNINVENLFGNHFLNFFLLSLIELPSHLITWILLDRVGRRWVSMGFLGVTGIICLLPVLYQSGPSLFGVIVSLIGKFSVSSSFMAIYQQAPELYPTPLRGIALSISVSISNVVSMATPYIVGLGKFSNEIPFLVFSVLTLCGSVCAFFLPETLNKKLPQSIADAEEFGAEIYECCGKKSSVSLDHSNSITPQEKQQCQNGIYKNFPRYCDLDDYASSK